MPDSPDQIDTIRSPTLSREAVDRVADAVAATGRPELQVVIQEGAGHACA